MRIWPASLHTTLHTCHREYLSQRHFSSVLYLNSSGKGFTGGDLCFKDLRDQPGEVDPLASPAERGSNIRRVTPRAGLLVAYAADKTNVHMVCGQRLVWLDRSEDLN